MSRRGASAWARTPAPQGADPRRELGHHPAQALPEQVSRRRSQGHLARAGAGAARREAPEPRAGRRYRQVVPRTTAPSVPLAGEREHGVRPGVHVPSMPRVRWTPRNGKPGRAPDRPAPGRRCVAGGARSKYSPRNGTMRADGVSPSRRATRSAATGAVTTTSTVTSPEVVRTTACPVAARAASSTSCAGGGRRPAGPGAPGPRTPRRSLITPVSATCSAATAATCGSCSRASARTAGSGSSGPLASRGRAARPAPASSSVRVATTSLPHTRARCPPAGRSAPSTRTRPTHPRLGRPGRVVQARVDDPAVATGLVTPPTSAPSPRR